MTQTIGFIGSGMISSQLARLAIAAGLGVSLSNSRGPETLADLVAELGDRAHAATPVDVARESDLVVASIPFVAYSKLPTEALAGKVVIDTMNFYPERDGEMAEVKTDTVATSELVQRHLDRSQVVRALNNLDWVRLFKRARPAGASDRSAVPIAGDDVDAKAAVARFIEAIGYDVVDMGPLAESWRSQPTAPVYVRPYIGEIPGDLTTETERSWFLEAPGAAVPRARVEQLVAQAVRHDRMHGSTASLAGASL
jgi:8-hydroxy-5-deazaflavin:NADPH oxidoreductase